MMEEINILKATGGSYNELVEKLVWRTKGLPYTESLLSLKSDEEKIKLGIEIMRENKQLLTIKQVSKSGATALEIINKATKNISSLSYQTVLDMYTRGLAYAPANSEAMAKAYANRSAVLCNERFYEAALDDVNDALEIGYPDNLKAKLYVRQAKAVIARFPSTLRGVDDCLQKAQFWSERMDPANKKVIQAAISKLRKNKTVPEPRETWFISDYLPNTPQGNSKILRTSSAVAIKNSDKFGRHLVATRDIKAGEALSVHQSYVSTLYPELYYNHCWHCTARSLSPIPCQSCVDVVYCSDQCRENSWNEYHDVECKVLGVMNRAKMCIGEILALKVLIKALKETGNSIKELREKVNVIESIADPIAKTYTNGRFDDTKYASFYSLMRLPMELSMIGEFVLKSIGLTYFLAALTDIFGKKMTDYEEIFANEDALFIARLLYHHQVIIRTNTMKVERENEKGEFMRHSGAVAPFFQLINHSCDRNVYHFTADDKNALIAVQPIKQGEQIFTSVGPEYIHLDTKERRAILHNIYDFHCDCYACKHDWCPTCRYPTCLDQKISHKGREAILKAKTMVERCIRPSLPNKMTIEERVNANLPKRIECIIKALNIIAKYCTYPNPELLDYKYELIAHYRAAECF